MEPAFENQDEGRKSRADLYVAAVTGDWGKAEEIFKKDPDCVRDRLSDVGDTALHLAVTAGQTDFAERLVNQHMKVDDLKQENDEKNTAFSLAAMTGNTRLAELMFQKKNELAMIHRNEKLPIQIAAMLGHEKMVKYLYQSTKDITEDKFTNDDRIELLVTLIKNDLYDVALMMVKDDKKGGLATLRVKKEKEGETSTPQEKAKKEVGTALHALARRPLRSNAERRFLSWSMTKKKKMHPKALELVQLLWNTIAKLDYDEVTKLIGTPWSLIHVAAENGNIEFLSVLIETHPDLIFRVDENGYTIFHSAVEYRHESIFKLVDKTPSIKSVIAAWKVGKEKNNILHLAAKLPPQNRLNIVSGAALQMQRELWWFEEVRQLMPPIFAEAKNEKVKNEKGETARALFTQSHKNLKKEGEEWMKKTAESCMIVATLITTIVFAAAFTLPGGVKEDTGAPNFIKKASFIVFATFDTISLVSSACSILSFLAILTARYAEEDFLWSLPRKLVVGLCSLFISIIGMMIVFCTTLFIVFDEGTKWPFVLAVPLALTPIIVFITHQTGLLFDVVKLQMHLSNYNFLKMQFKGRKPWMHFCNYDFLKRQSFSRLFQGKQSKEEGLKGRKPLKEDV